MDLNPASDADIADGGSSLSSLSSLSPSTAPVPKRNKKSHDFQRGEGHIPRPPNPFILYRSDFLKKRIIPTSVESKQQNISRVVAECWGRMSFHEQKVWRDLAREKAEEHKKAYPHYYYKPVKRVKARRRKAMTREQEVDHCAKLMATFIPERTGPVISPPGSHPGPPRKSRAKPRAVDTERPARATQSSRAQVKKDVPSNFSESVAALDSAMLVEPLFPPPTRPATTQPLDDTTVLDPDLQPLAMFDLPLPSYMDWEIEEDSSPRASAAHAEPIERQRPLSVGEHIQAQFDSARRGAIFPTMDTDLQGAQDLFNLDTFFTAQSAAQPVSAQSLPVPVSQEDFESLLASVGSEYQEHLPIAEPLSNTPPLFLPVGFEEFEALPDPSVSLSFPMTLTAPASEPLNPLRLQTPVFDTPQNPLDTLTLSFDQRVLDEFFADFALDGPFDLFGQAAKQLPVGCGPDAPAWSSRDMMRDLLNSEVCVTSAETV